MYADDVYCLAGKNLWEAVERGDFIRDETPFYYLYELTMGSRVQTGIVACVSIEDYLNNTVKKHENTRKAKEQDRIRHVEACKAQTGPVFLAYRKNKTISRIVDSVKLTDPIYDFTADDHVKQRVWIISQETDIKCITDTFEYIDSIYIADGHNRAAAAVAVGQKLKEANPDHDGTEEYNYVLSVLFPDEDLYIMEYNRILKELNGLTPAEFLKRVSSVFHVTAVTSEEKYPQKKGTFTMYLDGRWYECVLKPKDVSVDSVKGLDVSYLQELILDPILGITDPRTDPRIDFVGGIRGMEELERRCKEDCIAAFALYPPTIQEMFAVADEGKLMPPKSTWFEPKLQSGIFIHEI